jgi:hypothetical protein
MFFPVAELHETTLSSIGCILAKSTNSQAVPVVARAALLGLPSLFLSLARRNSGHKTDSAKYLKIVMNSFNFEDCVVPYASSKIIGIKVSAMLSLARLVRLYAAASIVASGDHRDGPEFDLLNASSYLRHQLNPETNGMCSSILGLWSLSVCPVVTANDAHFHPAFGIPIFSKNGSSCCFFSISDPPQAWMASLFYFQSVLAVVSESILRTSETFEFFLDNRRYGIFDALVNETTSIAKGKESVSGHIPTPVWFFLMPFICCDTPTQTYSAKMFGHTLLCNGCKVLSAFFVPESDMINQMTNERETATMAVNKLFSEINAILRLCGLGQDALFFRETDFMPDHSADAPHSSDVGISIRVFTSLCRWMPAKKAVGTCILERSLLSLIRIWIASEGGYAFDSETEDDSPTCNSSLASNAFDQLNEIFKRIREHPDSSHSTELSKHVDSIMSKVFGEFFLPQQEIAASTRYRLLSLFIGTFLLPSSANQSRRAQNTFEVSSAFEIMEFIDGVYPSVIVQLINDEDHGKCAIFGNV